MRAKLRNLFIGAILSLFGIVAGLVVLELGLRAFLPVSYSQEIAYLPDGHLGARLKPDQRYTLESGGICTINNLGFRGTTDLTTRKPAGVIRIVALGGSSTFSFDVDDQDTWTSVLERKLHQQFGPHIQVINAGVPGYSIIESKLNYLYQIRQLEPDIVVVYHTWNDLKFFHLIEQGIYPKKNPLLAENKRRRFLKQFQVLWRINGLLAGAPSENTFVHHPDDLLIPIREDGLAHQWLAQHYDDLATLLKKDGVLPIYTSQGGLLSKENIDDQQIRAVIYTEYVNFSYDQLLEEWQQAAQIIQQTAAKHDIPFVDMYNQVPHTTAYFFDHVHLTAAGNEQVANGIFETLTTDPELVATLTVSAR